MLQLIWSEIKRRKANIGVDLDFNLGEWIRGILTNDQLNNVRELVSMITPGNTNER